MSEFERTKAAGEKAEAFFEKYGKALIFPPDDQRIVLMLKQFQPKEGYFTDWPEHFEVDKPLEFKDTRKTYEEIHVEGADLDANIFDPSNENMIQGWIEVKASSNNALIRYGVNNSPSVPFEIYSNLQQRTPGWLWHLLHPAESNELRKCSYNKLRTHSPAAFVFCQYEGEIGATPPYATISFYDFPALASALIAIAYERYGWDLISWDLSGKKEQHFAQIRREIKDSNWNVCLSWLQEKSVPMAIYLLENPPRINKDGWYDSNMKTWSTLQAMAQKHYLLSQLKGDHEILKTHDQEPQE